MVHDDLVLAYHLVFVDDSDAAGVGRCGAGQVDEEGELGAPIELMELGRGEGFPRDGRAGTGAVWGGDGTGWDGHGGV